MSSEKATRVGQSGTAAIEAPALTEAEAEELAVPDKVNKLIDGFLAHLVAG